jgi:putative addiction module component (TIGR02574 family)
MMSTEEFIFEAVSLPVDIRLQVVERLLQSLNPTQKDMDEIWAIEAERRVQEIDTGKVRLVPGEDVFKKIRDRLSK